MRTLWIRIAPVALALLLVTPSWAKDTAAAPWTDAKLLEKHLGLACDVVEAICEAKYMERPTVRISKPADLVKALVEDLADLPEALVSKALRRPLAEAMSTAMMAKYDHETNVIHVVAEALDGVNERRKGKNQIGLDGLRILLVHEAAHALDFQRFDFPGQRKKRTTLDQHLALNAVVEGHAQWVAEQAANRWKRKAAFTSVTLAILGAEIEGSDLEKATHATQLAATRFAYGEGHTFFQAVVAARGKDGREEALRNPPTRSQEIERPALWLETGEEQAPVELKPILGAFRPVVGDKVWTVQTQRVIKLMLQGQAVRVPEAHRKDFLAGFEDAQMLVGVVPGEDAQAVAMVLVFDSAANAKLFVSHERLILENAKATPTVTFETKVFTDGAGTGERLPGMYLHRIAKTAGTEIHVHQEVFHVGRVACELLVVNLQGATRARMDAVVDHAAAVIRDPAAAQKATAPKAWPFVGTKRRVTVRVVDADGTPVPRALVTAVQGKEGDKGWERTRCSDGTCEVALDPTATIRLVAHGARDADGEPLNLTPSALMLLKEGQTEVELTMRPGRTMQGRVLDADGKPSGGVRVRIEHKPDGEGRSMLPVDVFGWTTTEEDGSFELAGLADGTYFLSVHAGGGPFQQPLTLEPTEVKAGAKDIEVRLPSTSAVRITVVDEEGAPVPGVRVSASPEVFPTNRGTVSNPSARTGTDGVAELQGLDAERLYELEVDLMHASGRAGALSSYKQGHWSPADTRIVLEKGWVLQGVVHDKERKPVQATVWLRKKNGWRSFPTKADGTFGIAGLPRKAIELAARPADEKNHDHAFTNMLRWTQVEPTEDLVKLAIKDLDRSGVIEVRVMDPDGKRVHRATVQVNGVSDGGRAMSGSTHQVRGTTTVKRPEGEVHLVAYRPRAADGTALPMGPGRVVLAADQRRVDVRLTSPRRVTGKVTARDGSPVEGVKVLAIPSDDGGAHFGGEHEAHALAMTGADGAFELVSLGKGAYRLHAKPAKPHVEPEPLDIGPEDTVANIRLGAMITMRVVDWRGAPVAEAYVSVTRHTRPEPGTHASHGVFHGRTNAAGKIQLREFPSEEEHRLEINPPPGRDNLIPAQVAPWTSTPDQTHILGRGFRVKGVVRDAQGPVTKAEVKFGTKPYTNDASTWTWTASTDERGRFTTKLIPYGPVRLMAQVTPHDWHADAHKTVFVEVTPDKPEVTLVMVPRTGVLKLRLKEAKKGWDGWVRRQGGGRVPFTFAADGEVSVPELIEGTYAVYVPDPDNEGRCVWQKSLKTGAAAVALAFRNTVTMKFRAKLPRGATDVEASVGGPAFVEFEPIRDADGTYVVKGLPPGTWVAEVYAKVGEAWYRGLADVDAETVPMVVLKPLEDD